MKTDTIAHDYPGYTVLRRQPITTYLSRGRRVLPFKAGDLLYFGNTTFTLNSVASSCIADRRCPIEGIKRAEANKHQLWWLNQNCAVISANPVKRPARFQITLDDLIEFEGHIFSIVKQHNNNLGLVKVDTSETVDATATAQASQGSVPPRGCTAMTACHEPRRILKWLYH